MLANDTDAVPKVKDRQKPSLLENIHNSFDNRISCCLVISPLGRAIRDFRSAREPLEAFRDAIKAHRSLYGKGRILHRDILARTTSSSPTARMSRVSKAC